MISACFLGVSPDPVKFMFAAISLGTAVLAIVALRKLSLSNKSKVGLIYTHLFGLYFPFALFSTNMACGLLCLPCFESPISLVLLSLPTTLILSTLTGFVVIPGYYMLTRKTFRLKDSGINRFVRDVSGRLGIKSPAIYILDMARPIAFSFRSFRSAIFLSVGMLDILNRKEKEVVLLHEISHIKSKSSLFKLSTSLMRLSPSSILRSFNEEVRREEQKADRFAVEWQGTSRHLNTSKSKLEKYKKALADRENQD